MGTYLYQLCKGPLFLYSFFKDDYETNCFYELDMFVLSL